MIIFLLRKFHRRRRDVLTRRGVASSLSDSVVLREYGTE